MKIVCIMTTLRRRALMAAVCTATVTATATAAVTAPAQAAPTITDTVVSIPTPDGVTLGAEAAGPTATGQHPLVVMPTSWGANDLEYHAIVVLLADAGYDVVAFAPRGMSSSTGVADFGDPKTVGDVSTVITWAAAHLSADPAAVAAMGVSYGAGVSLLAAEKDPRIKVVASLSGWTDFAESLLPSGSLAIGTLSTLATRTTGTSPAVRIGPQLTQLFTEAQAGSAGAAALVRSMAATRSPITGVAALNANHTAGLMANGLQDSLLPPRQLLTMFAQLTGPKRLELRTGDHSMPEAAALFGGSTAGPVADAIAWIDHYLRGVANSAGTAPPVLVQDTITGAIRTYPSWPGGNHPLDATLGLPGLAQGVNIGAATNPAWTSTITQGLNTPAESPYEQADITDPYRLTTVNTSTFSDVYSFLWNGAATTNAQQLTGSVSLRLTVSASASTLSFVAYLYDVDPSGTGTFMTAAPTTITNLAAGTTKAVTVPFQPVAWTLAPGHHLCVVIDSADHRWATSSASRTMLTLSSTTSAPAQAVLPSG